VSAPRVLVNGLRFAQPMSGVRRHAVEVYSRAARLLREDGGELVLLAPHGGLGYALPEVTLREAPRPVAGALRPWREARVLREATEGLGPFALVHGGHLPLSPARGTARVHLQHDARRAASPVGRSWMRAALREADSVVTVSRSTADELVRLGSPRRLAVVPNGGDHLPVHDPERTGRPFVLVPGHLEPRKDPLTAIRALAVDPHLPRLVFAGFEKGGMIFRMQSEAARLGVLDRVRYAGPVPDDELAGLYARCSAVLLPSRLEGFGIPILEAVRAGAPLAVSAIPAHAEVAPRETPRFDAGDPVDCARALAEALRQERAPAAVGSWNATAEALVEVWSSACCSLQAP
jgi:glycosyltransferase involved in cell wall biosynthesis